MIPRRSWLWLAIASLISSNVELSCASEVPIDAITFAEDTRIWHIPCDEALAALDMSSEKNAHGRYTQIDQLKVPGKFLRRLIDGKELINLSDLEKAGVTVQVDATNRTATLGYKRRSYSIAVRAKRVEVSLGSQQLRAWQGDRLVMQTRISSGRDARTPTGNFRAGPYKARRHYSSIYHNAYMPWSVQISGHVFIHGFASVPDYPASHGCIRLPLDAGNPARFFYEWVEIGTPVRVTNAKFEVSNPPQVARRSRDPQTISGRRAPWWRRWFRRRGPV